MVTISCPFYFFTEWQFFSWSICSQTMSGSYTTADFQLELSWQVCWWCTSYKTTWIIPGDISAGLRAVNYPGVSCNPDYTDRTSWLSIILSTALYRLNSVSKWISKGKMGMILRANLSGESYLHLRMCPLHKVVLSLNLSEEVGASWIPWPCIQERHFSNTKQ